ncbi:hypothetical protein [Aliikangiella coralliicola]|uniref:DNA alkylation repair protein n=1 Tax=Aliikangiella coralliicola TaxID=2592383 RepID=A0A545UIK9_9GAMM|nr:hypothetical protein [Aliikangiella coralliicola]TQV89298.1 hypothetical protein FLL46_03970 [Aliikangiella coralliicola]
MSKLKQQLKTWDGKSADDIAAIYHICRSLPNFINKTIKLMQNTEFQCGASWLLKYHCEQGGKITPLQVINIYRQVNELEHWSSQLHILQTMPSLPITQENQTIVESFLRRCIVSDNKFVRAWAYNGFDILATQHVQFRKEVDQFLEMAMRDEAASVKARIRNITKQRKTSGNK